MNMVRFGLRIGSDGDFAMERNKGMQRKSKERVEGNNLPINSNRHMQFRNSILRGSLEVHTFSKREIQNVSQAVTVK